MTEEEPGYTLVGTSNTNPNIDIRECMVEFGDGIYADYSANVLFENLYYQIDEEGRSHLLLSSISDRRSNDDAISHNDDFISMASSAKKRHITTKGWDLKDDWVDGTSLWIPLSNLKESNPIEVTE